MGPGWRAGIGPDMHAWVLAGVHRWILVCACGARCTHGVRTLGAGMGAGCVCEIVYSSALILT